MRKIILASVSVPKKEVFNLLGIPFKAVSSDYHEDMSLPLSINSLAKKLSLGKAEAVAAKNKNAVIIAADTFIVFRNHRLGKPKDEHDAKKMLKMLSGSTHYVLTGYAVLDKKNKKKIQGVVKTKVYFRTLSDKDIAAYVKTSEPLGKAGSYAIQGKGSVLVSKIEGDYFNVVGMPIGSIVSSLRKLGVL